MTTPRAASWSEPHGSAVRCVLCPHHCVLPEGKRGICLTRRTLDGALRTMNYCRPVSSALDPIEKKPLYHFLPGAMIFSTGPNGCTMKCAFCQNAGISQELVCAPYVEPSDTAAEVAQSHSAGIAYTYSEPYIWFETIMDTAPLVRAAGGCAVMVTNGYMEPRPLAELLQVIDAMNVDIKSMNPRFYRTLCKAELAPVLRSCEQVARAGCHLEITNLLIAGHNDTDQEIRLLARWIREHLGRHTPLHISRYFPRHRMADTATPEERVEQAVIIALEDLDHVYAGNLSRTAHADTRCSTCGGVLIRRTGHRVSRLPLLEENGRTASCGACGTPLTVRLTV